MLRLAVIGFMVLAAVPRHRSARANLLQIRITAGHATPLRAIWHPRAGVIGTTVDEQQRPLLNPIGARPPADSLRRWRDPLARDTVRASTPVEFVVDMNSGSVRIEVLSGDTVEVEAQLIPARGVIARERGRVFVVEADGREPSIRQLP